MKIVVYNKETRDNRIVRLKLEEDESDGYVDLIMVDETGKRVVDGYILSITYDGKLALHPSINSDFGLQLDKSGKIVVKK